MSENNTDSYTIGTEQSVVSDEVHEWTHEPSGLTKFIQVAIYSDGRVLLAHGAREGNSRLKIIEVPAEAGLFIAEQIERNCRNEDTGTQRSDGGDEP